MTPKYSLLEAAHAALKIATRALTEVRILALRPAPVGEAGPAGPPGKGFRVRGTFVNTVEYQANDIAMLNGSSFVALRDNPGPCPGDGWQLWAMVGRTGKPGERGEHGLPGERGLPGASVIGGTFNTKEMKLVLMREDGEAVTIDAYEFAEAIRSADR